MESMSIKLQQVPSQVSKQTKTKQKLLISAEAHVRFEVEEKIWSKNSAKKKTFIVTYLFDEMAAKVLERCCHPAKVRVWMEIERRRLVVHVFALVAINRDSQPIVSIVSDAYCGFHKPSNTSVSFSVPFAMSFNAINGGQRQLVVLVLILTIFPLVLLQVAALQIVCCVNSDYIWRLLVFMCASSSSHFSECNLIRSRPETEQRYRFIFRYTTTHHQC